MKYYAKFRFAPGNQHRRKFVKHMPTTSRPMEKQCTQIISIKKLEYEVIKSDCKPSRLFQAIACKVRENYLL